MKRKLWKNIKEQMGIIIQWVFAIIFLLSILVFVCGCLKSRFGGHTSNTEDKVYIIAFLFVVFGGILISGNFDTGARIAAIVICGLLTAFGLLLS